MAMTFWRLRDNRDAEICRWNQSPSKLLIIRRPLLRFLEAIRECPIRVMHLPVQCNISHCVAHPKKIRTHPASAGRTLTIFSLSFGYTRLNNTADPSNNPKRLCNWTPFASLFDQGGDLFRLIFFSCSEDEEFSPQLTTCFRILSLPLETSSCSN